LEYKHCPGRVITSSLSNGGTHKARFCRSLSCFWYHSTHSSMIWMEEYTH